MSSLTSTSAMLSPIITLNEKLARTHLPTIPLPLLFIAHAARVSLAYRGVQSVVRIQAEVKERGSGSKSPTTTPARDSDGWLYDLTGYLIMAWGGSFLTAYLSNSTPLQLLSPWPLITYSLVHIYIGILLSVIPPLTPALLDTILPLLDGATRSGAIIGGINLARNHATNALLRDSLLFQVLLGTLGACGGGQMAGTLNVFNRRKEGWTLGTPPILKAKSIIDAMDVVAALAGSLAYAVATDVKSWQGALQTTWKGAIKVDLEKIVKGSAIATPQQAQALTTLVVAACFAYRAIVLHWYAKQGGKTQGKRLQVESRKVQGLQGGSASPAGKKKSAK